MPELREAGVRVPAMLHKDGDACVLDDEQSKELTRRLYEEAQGEDKYDPRDVAILGGDPSL